MYIKDEGECECWPHSRLHWKQLGILAYNIAYGIGVDVDASCVGMLVSGGLCELGRSSCDSKMVSV